MLELFDRILVGSEFSCPPPAEEKDLAVIHACKSPCHQRAVGYRGNLDKSHPNYLVLEQGDDLFLNMIDTPKPLFRLELFSAALAFADRHWNDGNSVLFHCDTGRSRAPSLILCYVAKVRGWIADESFEATRAEFETRYDIYLPGRGIATYLTERWDEIGAK